MISEPWNKHTPGDPMPCKCGESVVEARFGRGGGKTAPARRLNWGENKLVLHGDITAWRFVERKGEDVIQRCAECDCEGGSSECTWIKSGPVMQYYYKNNACPAEYSRAENCICWQDEGKGPFPDLKNGDAIPMAYGSAIGLTWRIAPQPTPDREAMVRLLQIITRNGSLDDGRTLHEVIADALLDNFNITHKDH